MIIQSQRKEIDEILESKVRKLKGISENPIDLEAWNEFLNKFKELFIKHLSYQEQTKLLKELIYRVELGGKDVKVHFFVPGQ